MQSPVGPLQLLTGLLSQELGPAGRNRAPRSRPWGPQDLGEGKAWKPHQISRSGVSLPPPDPSP